MGLFGWGKKEDDDTYSKGYEAGTWTEEQLENTGGNEMSRSRLRGVQQALNKQQLVEDIQNMTPKQARDHAKYMEGVIDGSNDSLRKKR